MDDKKLTELRAQVDDNMADAEVGPLLDHIDALQKEIALVTACRDRWWKRCMEARYFATAVFGEAVDGKECHDRAQVQAEAESQGRVLVEKTTGLAKEFLCHYCDDGIAVLQSVKIEVAPTDKSSGPLSMYVCDRCGERYAPGVYGTKGLPATVEARRLAREDQSLVDAACRAEELFGVDACERFHEEGMRRDVQVPSDEDVFCDPPPPEQDHE